MIKNKILIAAALFFCFVSIVFGGDLDGYFVILHTNDIHGRAVSDTDSFGYAGIKFAKDSLKKHGAEVLLFDAGDFSQGTPIVNSSKGESVIDFMNRSAYDCVTLGNHEFDWGYENISRNLENAKFRIVCCNILRENENVSLFDTYTVFTLKSGKKIGVFGLDTPACSTSVNPKNIKGLKFLSGEEMFLAANKEIKKIKEEKCDLCVCLGHLGDVGIYPERSTDLIDNTEGIDLFVDGHSHTRIENGIKQNNTLRVSTGAYAEALGYVVYKETEKGFDFVKCGLADANSIVYDIMTAGEKQKYDRELKKYIDGINNKLLKEFSVPVGKTLVDLNGKRSPGNRTEETNLGDFFTDALLWKAKETDENTVASVINGGDIRTSIKKGSVSLIDLKTVSPFNNELCLIKLKGSELLEALEIATAFLPEAIGGFPQISGIEMTVNTKIKAEFGEKYPGTVCPSPLKPGSRVTIKTVGGKKFSKEDYYLIATTDFLAAGGDTYYVFKYPFSTAGIETGILLEDCVCEYVNKVLHGTIGIDYEKPAGRIEIIK